MKRTMRLATTVCCFGLMSGVLQVTAEEKPMPATDTKAAVTQPVFVCPNCHIVALKAGKCGTCTKEMKACHMLGMKNDKGMVCMCDAMCTCNATDMKDGMCSCGKTVETVSTKGLYACPEGCPRLADKSAKCACGKELKKSE